MKKILNSILNNCLFEIINLKVQFATFEAKYSALENPVLTLSVGILRFGKKFKEIPDEEAMFLNNKLLEIDSISLKIDYNFVNSKKTAVEKVFNVNSRNGAEVVCASNTILSVNSHENAAILVELSYKDKELSVNTSVSWIEAIIDSYDLNSLNTTLKVLQSYSPPKEEVETESASEFKLDLFGFSILNLKISASLENLLVLASEQRIKTDKLFRFYYPEASLEETQKHFCYLRDNFLLFTVKGVVAAYEIASKTGQFLLSSATLSYSEFVEESNFNMGSSNFYSSKLNKSQLKKSYISTGSSIYESCASFDEAAYDEPAEDFFAEHLNKEFEHNSINLLEVKQITAEIAANEVFAKCTSVHVSFNPSLIFKLSIFFENAVEYFNDFYLPILMEYALISEDLTDKIRLTQRKTAKSEPNLKLRFRIDKTSLEITTPPVEDFLNLSKEYSAKLLEPIPKDMSGYVSTLKTKRLSNILEQSTEIISMKVDIASLSGKIEGKKVGIDFDSLAVLVCDGNKGFPFLLVESDNHLNNSTKGALCSEAAIQFKPSTEDIVDRLQSETSKKYIVMNIDPDQSTVHKLQAIEQRNEILVSLKTILLSLSPLTVQNTLNSVKTLVHNFKMALFLTNINRSKLAEIREKTEYYRFITEKQEITQTKAVSTVSLVLDKVELTLVNTFDLNIFSNSKLSEKKVKHSYINQLLKFEMRGLSSFLFQADKQIEIGLSLSDCSLSLFDQDNNTPKKLFYSINSNNFTPMASILLLIDSRESDFKSQIYKSVMSSHLECEDNFSNILQNNKIYLDNMVLNAKIKVSRVFLQLMDKNLSVAHFSNLTNCLRHQPIELKEVPLLKFEVPGDMLTLVELQTSEIYLDCCAFNDSTEELSIITECSKICSDGFLRSVIALTDLNLRTRLSDNCKSVSVSVGRVQFWLINDYSEGPFEPFYTVEEEPVEYMERHLFKNILFVEGINVLSEMTEKKESIEVRIKSLNGGICKDSVVALSDWLTFVQGQFKHLEPKKTVDDSKMFSESNISLTDMASENYLESFSHDKVTVERKESAEESNHTRKVMILEVNSCLFTMYAGRDFKFQRKQALKEEKSAKKKVIILDDYFSADKNKFTQIKSGKYNTKPRDNYNSIALSLSEFQISLETEGNKLDLNLMAVNFELQDGIKGSCYNKLISKKDYFSKAPIIKLSLSLLKKESETLPDYFLEVDMQISPLNITLDMKSILLLASFLKIRKLADSSEVVEETREYTEKSLIFVKKLKIQSISVTINYRKSKLEGIYARKLKKYVQLANLINIVDAFISVQEFKFEGMEIIEDVLGRLIKQYKADVTSISFNQLMNLINSISFIRPLGVMFVSFVDLFKQPYIYFNKGNLQRGLAVGVGQLFKNFSIQSLFIGEKLYQHYNWLLLGKEESNKPTIYKKLMYKLDEEKEREDKVLLKK